MNTPYQISEIERRLKALENQTKLHGYGVLEQRIYALSKMLQAINLYAHNDLGLRVENLEQFSERHKMLFSKSPESSRGLDELHPDRDRPETPSEHDYELSHRHVYNNESECEASNRIERHSRYCAAFHSLHPDDLAKLQAIRDTLVELRIDCKPWIGLLNYLILILPLRPEPDVPEMPSDSEIERIVQEVVNRDSEATADGRLRIQDMEWALIPEDDNDDWMTVCATKPDSLRVRDIGRVRNEFATEVSMVPDMLRLLRDMRKVMQIWQERPETHYSVRGSIQNWAKRIDAILTDTGESR